VSASLTDFAAEATHGEPAIDHPWPEPSAPPPAPVEQRSIPAALTPVPPRRNARPLVAGVALLALIALAAVYLTRSRDGEPSTATAQAPSEAAAPAPAPAAAPPPAIEKPPAAEIVALRRVWLRVVVDGARVVEREVEAETRIPIPAAAQIVVRAGDAGAVRVSIAGKDQGPLGTAGQPITRRFEVGNR
jgi:hypothetical protein